MENKNFRQLVEESLINNKQLDEGFVKNLALAGALAGSVAAVTPISTSNHILSSVPFGDSIVVHKDTGHYAAPYIKTHHKEMIEKFGNTHPHIFSDLAHSPHANSETFSLISSHPNADAASLQITAKKTSDYAVLHTLAHHANLDETGMRNIAQNMETVPSTIQALKNRGLKDAFEIHKYAMQSNLGVGPSSSTKTSKGGNAADSSEPDSFYSERENREAADAAAQESFRHWKNPSDSE